MVFGDVLAKTHYVQTTAVCRGLLSVQSSTLLIMVIVLELCEWPLKDNVIELSSLVGGCCVF